MDFSMKDIALITTMSGAIIFMSFTFPALGMADDGNQTSADDIPEFNLSSTQIDIVDDLPEQPGTPTTGVLKYDGTLDSPNGIEGISLETLDPRQGDMDDSLVVEVQNSSSGFFVGVTYFNGSAQQAYADTYPITGEGQTILHQNNSWNIQFAVDSIENELEPNMTAEVGFQVLDSPSESGGGLSAIPVIGGLFAAGAEIASMVGWIGQIILWAVAFIFEIILTWLLTVIELWVFIISLMNWLISTYTSIIARAGSWAGVVLTIPLLILLIELFKVAAVLIELFNSQ